MSHPFTIFVMLRALPPWLALRRDERARSSAEAFAAAACDGVAFRHYDAEAFSAFASDVVVFETQDLRAYYFVIERLRDTPIFSHPYFDLVEIVPAIADGFRQFEAQEKVR